MGFIIFVFLQGKEGDKYMVVKIKRQDQQEEISVIDEMIDANHALKASGSHTEDPSGNPGKTLTIVKVSRKILKCI